MKINLNLLSKYDRIVLIKDLGLNTTKIITVNDIKDLYRLPAYIKNGIISVRSEGGISNKCLQSISKIANVDRGRPLHIISVSYKDLIDFCKNNRCVFDAKPLYIYEGIPNKGRYSGAVYVGENMIRVELCEDCYVRSVTHCGKIDYAATLKILNGKFVKAPIHIKEIRAILEEVIKIPLVNFVAEVSYFKYRVGYKRENVIIWDLGGDAKWYYKNRRLI